MKVEFVKLTVDPDYVWYEYVCTIPIAEVMALVGKKEIDPTFIARHASQVAENNSRIAQNTALQTISAPDPANHFNLVIDTAGSVVGLEDVRQPWMNDDPILSGYVRLNDSELGSLQDAVDRANYDLLHGSQVSLKSRFEFVEGSVWPPSHDWLIWSLRGSTVNVSACQYGIAFREVATQFVVRDQQKVAGIIEDLHQPRVIQATENELEHRFVGVSRDELRTRAIRAWINFFELKAKRPKVVDSYGQEWNFSVFEKLQDDELVELGIIAEFCGDSEFEEEIFQVSNLRRQTQHLAKISKRIARASDYGEDFRWDRYENLTENESREVWNPLKYTLSDLVRFARNTGEIIELVIQNSMLMDEHGWGVTISIWRSRFGEPNLQVSVSPEMSAASDEGEREIEKLIEDGLWQESDEHHEGWWFNAENRGALAVASELVDFLVKFHPVEADWFITNVGARDADAIVQMRGMLDVIKMPNLDFDDFYYCLPEQHPGLAFRRVSPHQR